jgi:SPP1 gp7 family putative phage head morphogenesis protein
VSTPARLYKNAIDLNRYSNSVARRVINSYNDIIIDAVNQLRTIDDLAAPVKAARLRSILAQLKESLDGWAGDSTEITATELQGIAELQSQFVTDELRKALPAGVTRSAVNTVEISPQFAQSVVTTDPTQINVVALSDDLFAAVNGAPQTFSLTAAQGATITLPNGEVVSKAFRGIATSQAERFSQVVRNGLLTGETTFDIAKRLIGSLQFGEEAKTVGQLAAAGGQATQVADNQILTLIRTSINQVVNTASQQVYEANQDITQKYRYVATLDTRTSAICRALDGREFEYGKGPMPPQHFNCLPGDALVLPSGRIAAVYRRRYEGFLYVIKTADGNKVRVTPNHPILTSAGWQPAQSIKVGDKVFSRSIIPNKLVHNYQEGDTVTTAEDIFGAFRKSSTVLAMEVPTTTPDFHGDTWSGSPGIDLAKQIAVVLADRELLLAVNPALLKTLLNFGFQGANPAATSGSHLDLSDLAIGSPTLSSIGSSGQGFALGAGSATHASKLLLTSISEIAPRFNDDALYGTWRDVEAIRDPTDADPVVIGGNNQVDVTWVGREPFGGHVYNFETEGGTYWANGILTHNCRSTTVPVINYKELGFSPPPPARRASMDGQVPADESYGEWLKKQPRTTQADVLGEGKVAYFNRLANKYGAQNAMAKLVRDDGSELTLAQLRKRYGPVD